MGIKLTKTKIDGVLIIEPDYFCDDRGYYAETFSQRSLKEKGVILKWFVQDAHSFNKHMGTMRGLHFQNRPHNQTKIVRCIRGRMIDIAVDLRRDSTTYLQSVAIELSSENHKQLLIPNYCAHGYITLEDDVEMVYKLDDFWFPECEKSINIFDPSISIDLPKNIKDFIRNEKDKNAPLAKDVRIDV